MKIFSRNIGAINSATKANLHSVVKKMRQKTSYIVNEAGTSFTTTYVTGGILRENGNALYDVRVGFFRGKKTLGELSNVKYNDKRYIIDNSTGKVIPEKSSLKERIFGLSKKTIKNISAIINKVAENFENPQIVEQWSWGICGFTQKGAKILDEASKKVRLQKLL